jgi:hypothetical protein
LWRLIYTYAQQLRLDPYAVAAVSVAEGGGRFGAVGDQGSSYGPFQLRRGGALPTGQGAGWANSASGVFYAMQHMANSGAAGLHGLAAIRAIVTRFERPAAPGPEVARSWGSFRGWHGDPGFNVNMGGGGIDPGFFANLRHQQQQQQQRFLTELTQQAAASRQQSLAQNAANQLLQRHQAGAQAQMQLVGQPAAGLLSGDPTQTLAEQTRLRGDALRQQALKRAGIA